MLLFISDGPVSLSLQRNKNDDNHNDDDDDDYGDDKDDDDDGDDNWWSKIKSEPKSPFLQKN